MLGHQKIKTNLPKGWRFYRQAKFTDFVSFEHKRKGDKEKRRVWFDYFFYILFDKHIVKLWTLFP